MYSTALLVTEELGYEVKCKARIWKESPKWKIRLENKVAYVWTLSWAFKNRYAAEHQS